MTTEFSIPHPAPSPPPLTPLSQSVPSDLAGMTYSPVSAETVWSHDLHTGMTVVLLHVIGPISVQVICSAHVIGVFVGQVISSGGHVTAEVWGHVVCHAFVQNVGVSDLSY